MAYFSLHFSLLFTRATEKNQNMNFEVENMLFGPENLKSCYEHIIKSCIFQFCLRINHFPNFIKTYHFDYLRESSNSGFSSMHTSVYWALFPINLITELVNPLRNTFGLAELQLLIYFGQ